MQHPRALALARASRRELIQELQAVEVAAADRWKIQAAGRWKRHRYNLWVSRFRLLNLHVIFAVLRYLEVSSRRMVLRPRLSSPLELVHVWAAEAVAPVPPSLLFLGFRLPSASPSIGGLTSMYPAGIEPYRISRPLLRIIPFVCPRLIVVFYLWRSWSSSRRGHWSSSYR